MNRKPVSTWGRDAGVYCGILGGVVSLGEASAIYLGRPSNFRIQFFFIST